jgi:hypothetical protein
MAKAPLARGAVAVSRVLRHTARKFHATKSIDELLQFVLLIPPIVLWR